MVRKITYSRFNISYNLSRWYLRSDQWLKKCIHISVKFLFLLLGKIKISILVTKPIYRPLGLVDKGPGSPIEGQGSQELSLPLKLGKVREPQMGLLARAMSSFARTSCWNRKPKLGTGNSSLGNALFRSLKSMQTHFFS